MDKEQNDENMLVPAEDIRHVSGSAARKIFLIVFSVVAVFVLGIMILTGAIASKLLATKPVEYTPEALDMVAFSAVQRKIIPVYQQMFRSKPEDSYKLTLSEKEINVILTNVQTVGKTIMGTQLSNDDDSRFVWPAGLNVKYADKCFCCEYSYELPFSILFGKYINLYGRFIPEMKNGNIKFTCKDVRAGKIGVPAKTVNQTIINEISANNEDIAPLTKIISDFYIDESGLLHVTIYPYALRVYIMEYMKRRMEERAEEERQEKLEKQKEAKKIK